MASEHDNESTFSPERKLCPDGGCIGIIGDDGRCTVCGTSDKGVASSPAPDPETGDSLDDTEVEPSEPGIEASPSGFDPNRRLCSDDDCVGVIGEDNRCRLCGKPAAT